MVPDPENMKGVPVKKKTAKKKPGWQWARCIVQGCMNPPRRPSALYRRHGITPNICYTHFKQLWGPNPLGPKWKHVRNPR
jgi:hypothetical protein